MLRQPLMKGNMMSLKSSVHMQVNILPPLEVELINAKIELR